MTHPRTTIIANNPDAYPRRIYVISYGTVVARNVFTIDWGMPASMGMRLRVLDTPNQLKGLEPDPLDDSMWLSPNAYDNHRIKELIVEAIRRGFVLKQWYEHPDYHCPKHPNPILRRDLYEHAR